MPRLQKQKSWKRGKETYYKWAVTLPEEEIKEAGLKEGDFLVARSLKKGQILLYKEGTDSKVVSDKKKK